MADKIITVAQVVGGVFVPDTTIASPRIIQVEDPAVIIPYTHIGSGRYSNTLNVPDGTYKFYDGATEKPNVLGANGEWIGDSSLPYVPKSGATDIVGILGYTTEIDLSSADAKVIPYKKYVDLADGVQHAYTDEKYADAVEYIDQQISNIPSYSLPQSPRLVRFWEGASAVTSKIYNNLLYAVNSLTLASGEFATVLIEGLTSYLYRAPATTLSKSGVTFKSLNKNWGIAFPDGVINKLVNLENLKVIFGTGNLGGYSGATRQYTGFGIVDCDIYCYNNLALYDGSYRNVNFYMAAGKSLTFFGSAILNNVKCNSAIAFDAGYSGFKDYTDSLGDAFIPGAAMPTDPTTNDT